MNRMSKIQLLSMTKMLAILRFAKPMQKKTMARIANCVNCFYRFRSPITCASYIRAVAKELMAKDTIRLERIAKVGLEIVVKVAAVRPIGISCAKIAVTSKKTMGFDDSKTFNEINLFSGIWKEITTAKLSAIWLARRRFCRIKSCIQLRQ